MNKEEVESVIAALGEQCYVLNLIVTEDQAMAVVEKLKSLGYANFLRSTAGNHYEVVILGKMW